MNQVPLLVQLAHRVGELSRQVWAAQSIRLVLVAYLLLAQVAAGQLEEHYQEGLRV